MRLWRICSVLFLSASLFAASGLWAQGADTGGEDATVDAETASPFPLIPILQTALHGELQWHPGWPEDFPPDAFVPAEGRRSPLRIELSNGEETFVFRRDRYGRLCEFPFFRNGLWLRVTAAWSASGEIASLSVIPVRTDSRENELPSENESPPESQLTWEIEFPAGAFSSGPPGPPVKAANGNMSFFVFNEDNNLFLSETWYDGEGNPLALYRAGLRQADGETRRIYTLQSYTRQGLSVEEYFYDSDGNVTGIHSPNGTFSALYRNHRPQYWERQPSSAPPPAADSPAGPSPAAEPNRFSLQWDQQGLLAGIRPENPFRPDSPVPPDSTAAGHNAGTGPVPAEESFVFEYRYEYRQDAGENWTSRQDISIVSSFGVFVPRPGQTWTRRIRFTEE
ncbi:MAG: hypothetical protein LBD48_02970 [Treponema sp.]|jgi:YD repeat-containing protein|nr:hypothetical protein [Treponema sp.]